MMMWPSSGKWSGGSVSLLKRRTNVQILKQPFSKLLLASLVMTVTCIAGSYAQRYDRDPEELAEADMKNKTLKITKSFRSMAEDTLGCIDTLSTVESKPDSIFVPQ